jgi:hypothetical protein
MAEHPRHVFGRFRTTLKLHAPLGLNAVLAALREGRATITNGVMLELEAVSKEGEACKQNDCLGQKIARVRVRASSSPEFGRLQRVTIWRGDLALKKEQIFYECKNFVEGYKFEAVLDWPGSQTNCYLRAEALSAFDSSLTSSHALTNPIWVSERAE